MVKSHDELPLDDATVETLLARVRYVVDAEVVPPHPRRTSADRDALEQFVAGFVAIETGAAIGPAVGRTGIGNVSLESRLDGSLSSYGESDDIGKVRQLGDLVLGFLRSQGVELGDDLHPLSDL